MKDLVFQTLFEDFDIALTDNYKVPLDDNLGSIAFERKPNISNNRYFDNRFEQPLYVILRPPKPSPPAAMVADNHDHHHMMNLRDQAPAADRLQWLYWYRRNHYDLFS